MPVSPTACSVVLGYGSFTVEDGKLLVVISGAMVSANVVEFVSAGVELSVTWTVKFETAAVFGFRRSRRSTPA